MSSITEDRIYPHPREKVWRALTDPELLARPVADTVSRKALPVLGRHGIAPADQAEIVLLVERAIEDGLLIAPHSTTSTTALSRASRGE